MSKNLKFLLIIILRTWTSLNTIKLNQTHTIKQIPLKFNNNDALIALTFELIEPKNPRLMMMH